jgi:hypothetical protein
MDMQTCACAHSGVSTLRPGHAGRRVNSTPGGLRTTPVVRAFVKENHQ